MTAGLYYYQDVICDVVVHLIWRGGSLRKNDRASPRIVATLLQINNEYGYNNGENWRISYSSQTVASFDKMTAVGNKISNNDSVWPSLLYISNRTKRKRMKRKSDICFYVTPLTSADQSLRTSNAEKTFNMVHYLHVLPILCLIETREKI